CALQTAENEELRRAHAKRHDRLRLIQTNYRAVKEQLKEVEDTHGLPKGRTRRAEPRELRQENSDAVWNELAFFKRENKKLLAEKAQLEEELDVARVRVAMERATAQELRLRLHEEQQGDRNRTTSKPPDLIRDAARAESNPTGRAENGASYKSVNPSTGREKKRSGPALSGNVLSGPSSAQRKVTFGAILIQTRVYQPSRKESGDEAHAPRSPSD
ncbi:hypothetical protein PDJAM_G00180900, partial [Pangasius djambal]|nr:hypothetical protein [Pangasius djambal]